MSGRSRRRFMPSMFPFAGSGVATVSSWGDRLWIPGKHTYCNVEKDKTRTDEFPRYTAAKRALLANTSLQDDVKTHMLSSLVAGTVATTICAPADVLKSRVQAASKSGAGSSVGPPSPPPSPSTSPLLLPTQASTGKEKKADRDPMCQTKTEPPPDHNSGPAQRGSPLPNEGLDARLVTPDVSNTATAASSLLICPRLFVEGVVPLRLTVSPLPQPTHDPHIRLHGKAAGPGQLEGDQGPAGRDQDLSFSFPLGFYPRMSARNPRGRGVLVNIDTICLSLVSNWQFSPVTAISLVGPRSNALCENIIHRAVCKSHLNA